MKKTLITSPNPKNTIVAQVIEVVELGKATGLTLGNGNSLFEGPDGRPARRS